MGFTTKEDRKQNLGDENIGIIDNNSDLNPHIVRGETSGITEGGKERLRTFSVRISADIYEKLINFQRTEAKKFETQRYIAERALEIYLKERNFV